MTLGQTIRERRKARGWSIRALGSRAGVNAPNIGRIEKGLVTCPKGPTLLRIARALNCDATELAKLRKPHLCPARSSKPAKGTLAHAVLRKRMAAAVTQAELMRRSGLSRDAVMHLESNRHKPSFTTLERYAAALNLTVSELLRDDGRPGTG